MVVQEVSTVAEFQGVLEEAAQEYAITVLFFCSDSDGKQRLRYQELSEKYLKIRWCQTAVDEGSALIQAHGVKKFPTYKLFIENNEVQSLVGATLEKVEAALMHKIIPVPVSLMGCKAHICLWGHSALGNPVHRITFMNATNLEVSLISYGAALQSCRFPNKRGNSEELCLNCGSMAELEGWGKQYYPGGTIGRVANRIADGLFVLDDQEYDLACNDGTNHLHGGYQGFDKYVWDYEVFEEPGEVGVKFHRVSLNGEEGYPGTLNVEAIYTISEKGNRLKMEYKAKAVTGPSVVDMTNHTYWNLSGNFQEDIGRQELWVNADKYLLTDKSKIPTGKLADVQGTPLNFLAPVALKWRMSKVKRDGMDHCFMVNRRSIKKGDPVQVATISHPENGRTMTIYSTQPALQVYTGNNLSLSNEHFPFIKHNGIVIQPQQFPNSVNSEDQSCAIRIEAGESYRQCTYFEFSLENEPMMNGNNPICHVCKCF
mmetsp:Transcript_34754/g.45965  ORF Transcript_34754/g.45965 Transcript_34754/m.45965 type:complete len:485 (-) Transcript_34754:124-1578(-)